VCLCLVSTYKQLKQISLWHVQWIQLTQVFILKKQVWEEDPILGMELDDAMSIGNTMKCLHSSNANMQNMLCKRNFLIQELIWFLQLNDGPRLQKNFKTRSMHCCHAMTTMNKDKWNGVNSNYYKIVYYHKGIGHNIFSKNLMLTNMTSCTSQYFEDYYEVLKYILGFINVLFHV
jgi:hypothetical protein